MAAQNSISRAIEKRRGEITALPMYYSGQLLKKYTGEKDFKKFFAELRGSTIFLYMDDKSYKCTEKLELQYLKEMHVESPRPRGSPSIYTLTLEDEEVKFKIDDPNTAEEWRGFILTVANLKIPSKIQLLPGQLLNLEQVLEQERTRTSELPSPVSCTAQRSPALSTPPTLSNSVTPQCFYEVSRMEAEQMLEDNPQCGSILLRPSGCIGGYAVSMRQILSSGPVMRHYKVQSHDSGLVIELNEPVTVPSLQDVLDYFLTRMEYRVLPYRQSQPYDTFIETAKFSKR
ncbi:signal-transducing adaptor protein 1-like [Conger conger]|uniref:signal-transducing adaptor protein 1-like n=1 Tax=Conger conger TaxID=82655 RepID=UPI002A5A921E|nr:signal-transducing adaptor protein 1-like [Conger conger]